MPMLDAGVLQFDVTIGDRGANFAKVEALLAAEAAKGRSPGAGAARAVEPPATPWSASASWPPGRRGRGGLSRGLARKYGLWFVGGSVLASVPGGYANRAQVIDPEGRLVATYDKIHRIRLMEEDRYFLRGNAGAAATSTAFPRGSRSATTSAFPNSPGGSPWRVPRCSL
ncbi:hypothetical protein [Aminiphilus circumscriptus]|uniref:hypothetical protein n=1 Tax=Aminiphilus circumscriptus TaxID=290732 RepID=UPI0004B472DB|nr:hypothetical protein [Aminiphilus circumscriptus]